MLSPFLHLNEEEGASSNPCSDIYAGPTPLSEPETSSVADFIMQENMDESFVGFLTVHSYGQYWLCPWGYDEIYPDDYDELVSSSTLVHIREHDCISLENR